MGFELARISRALRAVARWLDTHEKVHLDLALEALDDVGYCDDSLWSSFLQETLYDAIVWAAGGKEGDPEPSLPWAAQALSSLAAYAERKRPEYSDLAYMDIISLVNVPDRDRYSGSFQTELISALAWIESLVEEVEDNG